jgi:hypothetical protein
MRRIVYWLKPAAGDLKNETDVEITSDSFPALKSIHNLLELPVLQFQRKMTLIKEEQSNQFKEIHSLQNISIGNGSNTR